MAIDKAQIFKQVMDFIVKLLEKPKIVTAKPGPVAAASAPVYKITKEELLKGRDKQYASEYSAAVSDNLDKLLVPLNKIREKYGKPMTVNSGWRPSEVNSATPGAATKSKHIQGLAVDISDADGALMRWVLQNLDLMQELNIYMEDFRWTQNWCHFQLGAPGSGKRIFVPSTARASAPEKWDGVYDKKFDSK